ncbi:MAG: YIP1 family protein [Clostridia bacterium]|nr:YIP1 family protein [Clostridia bacterium]
MKKKWIIGVVAVACLLSVSLSVGAKSISYTPYQGYEYNDYGESTATPVGYVPDTRFDSSDMGLEVPLDAPQDFYYDGKDSFYILDSGNGRIVELNASLQVKTIYDTFVTEDGEVKDITGATGLALNSKGDFYIAHPDDYEVIKIERATGTVTQVITRPDEKLLDIDSPFMASKVTVDNRDQLYILVESINKGAFVYNAQGEFMHFFGSNPIVQSAEMIYDYIWKRFMTKEQRKGLTRITPTVFNNFDVDGYGFLYTVTSENGSTAKKGTVRRLNYSGSDILTEGLIFGDQEWDRGFSIGSKKTTFIDVEIDNDGYINLLDAGRGRVFQYTTNGEVIAEFGTYSEQTGGFTTPVAVESIGDTVYVLDAGKNAIQSFRPSDYGKLLRKAFLMLNTTDTDAALDIWSQVMQLSTNSQYAYYGIGTVYDTLGEYEKAMEYFKLAGAHDEYSKSLREYRKEFVNEQYLWIILVVIVLVLAISWVVKAIKKRSVLVDGTAYSALETKYLFPVYTTLHPADGFAQFKDRKIHSLRLSVLLMVAWFFLDTFSFFYTGYSFNMDRPMDYNFATTLLFTIGLMVLFIIANWSVCTLLNGKGTLKEITATCSYALVPYLISILVNTLLSNILTGEEAAIMTIISAIGLLWSALLLFIGLQSIHQYGFAGTFFSIILTIFGMAIICFLLLLFYTLVQQAVSFIKSVYTELSLR